VGAHTSSGDEQWAFKAFVQLSRDGGGTWSSPALISTAEDVHDAFPLARRSGGADLYYLRASAPGTFHVHRRALGEDGALGVEQVVTAPELGHIEKPQARRLPDGRVSLSFVIRRSDETFEYDLALEILEDDAPI
jgi:hypothetical protein